MDYRTRYHQLVGFDKWLLWLTLAWSILGTLSNYVRVHTDNNLLNVILQFAVMALWLVIAVTIIRSIPGAGRLLRDYGFSFRLGGLISLAAVVAFSAYKMVNQQAGTELIDSTFVFKVTGAFMEEIVFRAVAINIFISYLDGIKGKTFWAIIASTIIWTIPHIPSKTLIEWEWLFVSSIISGYIYRWSRSILLPAWLHVASNTSWFGGLVACIAYLVIAAIDFLILARRSRRSRSIAT
jgi:membrane protease YdiL (CAAX protease family)